MSINQKIVNINDTSYIINAFVGTKGFKLLAKVTKYSAPVIAQLAEQEETERENIDIGSILQGLFFEGTDEFVNLVFELVSDVEKDGSKINIDKEFKQNYMALLELALEVIKLNYSDVFQKLGMNLDSK